MTRLSTSTLALSLAALVAVAGTVRAQGTSVAPSGARMLALSEAVVADPPPVGPRLVAALRSPSETVRAEALHAIGTLAYSYEGANIEAAVPALLAIFRTEDAESLRVMSLRILERSEEPSVKETLLNEAKPEARRGHPKVQHLLFAILIDQHGADALRYHDGVDALAKALYASSRR